MRKLQTLFTAFVMFLVLISFSAGAEEHSNPAEHRFHLVLEPVRDMVPGDRIERSVLLQNLSGQDLKYSVEKITCRGTDALLRQMNLTLQDGETRIFSDSCSNLQAASGFTETILQKSHVDKQLKLVLELDLAATANVSGETFMVDISICSVPYEGEIPASEGSRKRGSRGSIGTIQEPQERHSISFAGGPGVVEASEKSTAVEHSPESENAKDAGASASQKKSRTKSASDISLIRTIMSKFGYRGQRTQVSRGSETADSGIDSGQAVSYRNLCIRVMQMEKESKGQVRIITGSTDAASGNKEAVTVYLGEDPEPVGYLFLMLILLILILVCLILVRILRFYRTVNAEKEREAEDVTAQSQSYGMPRGNEI